VSFLDSIFGGGNDAAAAAAAAAQASIAAMERRQRQHDEAVTAGKGAIDQAFSGFGDDYFQKYNDAYQNRYQPELSDMYSKAKGKLTAILAGRETLDSSIGADSLAAQQKTYNNAQADITNRAADATNGLKSTVSNTKGQLYANNVNAADPLAAASQAQAQAGALVNPASYGGQLSNVFADGLSAFSTANTANKSSASASNLFPWNAQQQYGSAPPLASGQGSGVFSGT
jgi:hypothetical protein